MPRQSFSSVCPRRTPPIPVRRLIPAAEKENAPPRKRTDAQKIERKKISSQPAGCSIFFVSCNKKNELTFINSFLVGEGGFEPPKSLTTDLQSAPFGHSGILPYLIELLVKKWSWWTDSNPRPADYKSAALPAELHQRKALSVLLLRIPDDLYIISHYF